MIASVDRMSTLGVYPCNIWLCRAHEEVNSHTWMRMNVARDVWMLAIFDHMSTLGVHLCRISYEYDYVTWHMWMIAPVDHVSTVGVCSCDIQMHRAYEYVTSHMWIRMNMSHDNINDLDPWLQVYFRRVSLCDVDVSCTWKYHITHIHAYEYVTWHM